MSTEKKLTAMQELINYIQEMQDCNFVSDIEYIKDKAISKLELEKQQIIDACDYFGNLNGVDKEDFEQYYNETFKN